MDEPIFELTAPESEGQNRLLFAIPHEELGGLLRSLFGRPQTITWVDRTPFIVTRPILEQFHHLLVQRVSEQHNTSYTQFVVSLFFDDGSGVTLNDFSDFCSYNETRPLVTEAILMSWTFLVAFPGRSVPESQKVEISFKRPYALSFLDPVDDLDNLLDYEQRAYGELIINHTARTWALDIQSLLQRQFLSSRLPQNTLSAWLDRNRKYIAISIMACILGSALAFGIQLARYSSALQEKIFHGVIESGGVEQKIDAIAEVIVKRELAHSDGSSLAIIMALVLGLLLFPGFLWFTKKLRARHPSFILFTERDVLEKDLAINRISRRAIRWVVNLVLAIVIGVLGNFAYDWLVQ